MWNSCLGGASCKSNFCNIVCSDAMQMQCRCNAASCKLACTVRAAHAKNSNILKKSGLHEAPTKEHYGVFNNFFF